MKFKQVTVCGKLYSSMKEAATAFGLKLNTVSCRLRDGWSIEEAFGAKQRSRSKFQGEQIIVAGKVFKSRAEACRAFNLSPKIVHHRLKHGWTIEQAFGIQEFAYKGRPKHISIGGQQFRSLAEACRFFGVDKYVVNARVNRYGWTVEQALGVDPRPGYERGVAGIVYLIEHEADGRKYIGVTMGSVDERWDQHVRKALSGRELDRRGLHHAIKFFSPDKFKFSVVAKAKNHSELQSLEIENIKKFSTLAPTGFNLNGGGSGSLTKGKAVTVQRRRFASYQEACRTFQIPWHVAKGRISLGWSLEQVFGLEEREYKVQPKAVEAQGKRFRSLTQAAIAFGVNPETFTQRLRKGWSLNQALGIEPRGNQSIVVGGRTFSSGAAAARHYGIKKGTFDTRRQKGWTLDQALGISDPPESRSIEYRCKRYKSYSQLADAFGIKRATLFARLKLGWNLDRALLPIKIR